MNKIKNKYLVFFILAAIISTSILAYTNLVNRVNVVNSYSQFLTHMAENKVSSVILNNSDKITVILNNGDKYKTDNPKTLDFREKLLLNNIQILDRSASNPVELISSMALGLSLLSILFIVLRSSNIKTKGLLSVEALETNAVSQHKHNFESVAGNEEAKESVKDIVDFLKNPKKYNTYGARMPKGIILYGEPGTGKTLLAKAVAGEAGVPFYALSGSDFVQVYVGVGASRIRSLFKKAKSHGQAVIFIDEIDAIGKKRDSSKNGNSDERDQTLNALLTEMSGFNEQEGIVVMAATNRLDMLDPALLRPGRFDRHIEVNLPDVVAREKILNLHLDNKPIGNIDVKEWAQKTSYFSGAKIESLVNEAAILACKEESPLIENLHLDKAFSIVLAGYEKIHKEGIKEEDRKITAYHEAGHALLSLKLLPEEKVSKITIIPSTKGAGGYTLSIPEDRAYQNHKYLKNRLMVLLGGRAAEEIIFGKDKITTGAYSDIKHITSMVGNMISEYGMGDTLGLLNLSELSNFAKVNSDSLVAECKDTVDELYEITKNVISENMDLLEKIAEALLLKETLYAEDLLELCNQ